MCARGLSQAIGRRKCCGAAYQPCSRFSSSGAQRSRNRCPLWSARSSPAAGADGTFRHGATLQEPLTMARRRRVGIWTVETGIRHHRPLPAKYRSGTLRPYCCGRDFCPLQKAQLLPERPDGASTRPLNEVIRCKRNHQRAHDHSGKQREAVKTGILADRVEHQRMQEVDRIRNIPLQAEKPRSEHLLCERRIARRAQTVVAIRSEAWPLQLPSPVPNRAR